MSFVHELHNQKPAVRYTLFALAFLCALGVVAFFGVASLQRDMFLALHSDPQEQNDFIARQDSRLPNPVAAIAKIAGSLTASIGSLIRWNRDAGFDRSSQPVNTSGGVHLLPVSD